MQQLIYPTSFDIHHPFAHVKIPRLTHRHTVHILKIGEGKGNMKNDFEEGANCDAITFIGI